MNSDNQRVWMLVDDDEAILQMLPSLLRTVMDVQIECFSRPQAALAAFLDAPERYELVITDFQMPGMNGMELCREVLAVSPAQKIFLITGSGFFTKRAAQLAGFSALLDKPFPLSALRATLAQVFTNNVSESFRQTQLVQARC